MANIPITAEPEVKWETWTPQKASACLSMQQQFGAMTNRALRPSLVHKYSADFSADRWFMSGDSCIVIDANGRLLNGQHRLHAIVESGVTVRLITVRGVAASAQVAMDTGLSRTPGDTLRGLPGVEGYYNAVAAAARIVCLYIKFGEITNTPDRQFTRSELVECVLAHPGIVDSVKWFRNADNQGGAPFRLKLTAGWHYLCGRKFPQERDLFFSNLIAGVNLRVDQPVRLLRERFIAQRSSQGKLPARVISAYIVKAFNAEVQGRPMKLLRFRNEEEFPLLIGDELPL